jgi:hypothetical protein
MQRGGEFCPSPSRPRCYAGGRRRYATGGGDVAPRRHRHEDRRLVVVHGPLPLDVHRRQSAIGAWFVGFTIKRTLTIPVVTWPSRARSDGQVPDGSAPSTH